MGGDDKGEEGATVVFFQNWPGHGFLRSQKNGTGVNQKNHDPANFEKNEWFFSLHLYRPDPFHIVLFMYG